MNNIKLETIPLRSAVLAGHDHTLPVLVRLRAPDEAPADLVQPPTNLSIVVDRSTSMRGMPLDETIRCVHKIIKHMDEDDIVSLVCYGERSKVLAKAQPVGNGRKLHRAAKRIKCQGRTALFDGWFDGAGQAARYADLGYTSRVLLLSDGNANVGQCNVEEIKRQCAKMAEAGVPTSTYGIGHRFNLHLMMGMAEAGDGRGYYGHTAKELMEPFVREFDLLKSLAARRITLDVGPDEGVHATVRNGYRQRSDGGWVLPDLAFGADSWAIVNVEVPGSSLEASESPVPLSSFTATYLDVHTQSMASRTAQIALPVVGPAAFEAIQRESTVQSRVEELDAADYNTRISGAVEVGDWATADVALDALEVASAKSPWLRRSHAALERSVAARKQRAATYESAYTAYNLRSRPTSAYEQADVYSPDIEKSRPSYTRRRDEEGASDVSSDVSSD